MAYDKVKQQQMALAKATKVKTERAKIKKQIKSGELLASLVLAEMPESVRTMTCLQFVSSQNRWAATRSSRMLKQINVTANRRLEDLTDRQLNILIMRLQDHETGQPLTTDVSQWEEPPLK